ncbi:MAG: hypothetical protein M3Q10_05725, partial [Chloroflexota bacterium]|nr:hypothetical protein [Chloroflexota bacterium]
VLAEPGLRAAAADLAREVEAVAQARGLELGNVVVATEEVARATAANRSSMLLDLEAGQRTETDAIYGSVLAAGAAFGIDTPANRVVAALVTARERRGSDGLGGDPTTGVG